LGEKFAGVSDYTGAYIDLKDKMRILPVLLANRNRIVAFVEKRISG
jgi:hypothetical protein